MEWQITPLQRQKTRKKDSSRCLPRLHHTLLAPLPASYDSERSSSLRWRVLHLLPSYLLAITQNLSYRSFERYLCAGSFRESSCPFLTDQIVLILLRVHFVPPLYHRLYGLAPTVLPILRLLTCLHRFVPCSRPFPYGILL